MIQNAYASAVEWLRKCLVARGGRDCDISVHDAIVSSKWPQYYWNLRPVQKCLLPESWQVHDNILESANFLVAKVNTFT